jgi:hypothetical protein
LRPRNREVNPMPLCGGDWRKERAARSPRAALLFARALKTHQTREAQAEEHGILVWAGFLGLGVLGI